MSLMAEARARQAWAHTSTVLAMLANVNRDPKKHGPYRPEDFHLHGSPFTTEVN